jgi:hypothetical protein
MAVSSLARSIGDDITKDVVDFETDDLSVYELAGNKYNTVYYGSGKLKTRLQDHLNKKECPMAGFYRFELFSTEAECRAREEQLLKDYEEKHGKLPMYNERIG